MNDGMKRWKVLHDKFVRELKKVKSKKSGDAGPSYTSTSCWAHIESLLFLQDSAYMLQRVSLILHVMILHAELSDIPTEHSPTSPPTLNRQISQRILTLSQG